MHFIVFTLSIGEFFGRIPANKKYAYAKMVIESSSFHVKVWNLFGQIVDQFELSKN